MQNQACCHHLSLADAYGQTQHVCPMSQEYSNNGDSMYFDAGYMVLSN